MDGGTDNLWTAREISFYCNIKKTILDEYFLLLAILIHIIAIFFRIWCCFFSSNLVFL